MERTNGRGPLVRITVASRNVAAIHDGALQMAMTRDLASESDYQEMAKQVARMAMLCESPYFTAVVEYVLEVTPAQARWLAAFSERPTA